MPALLGMGAPGTGLRTPLTRCCWPGCPGGNGFNYLLSRQHGAVRPGTRLPTGQPAGIHFTHGLDIGAALLDDLVRANLLVQGEIPSR